MKKLLLFLFILMLHACAGVHCRAQNKQLWGVTFSGGDYNAGVIFRTDSSGNNETVIQSLYAIPGVNPEYSDLIQAADSNLYGMTLQGGLYNQGILFQYNPSTSSPIKKIDFAGANGKNPTGSLVQATDGNLYGMTGSGGANGYGVLFQYNPSTSVLTKKIDFAGTSNGANPYGSLMQATDGNLYGITAGGGANNLGVLFQYNPSTSILTKKIDFAGISNGAVPEGSLIQAADGNLYGMTYGGGIIHYGVLFQYNITTSVLTKKVDFSDGAAPYGSLIQAADGNLYGMTYFGGANGGPNGYGVLFQYNPSTSTFTKKIDFAGTNGANPTGSLMQASDGNLYGMTNRGGANDYGVLFRYNPSTSVLTMMIDFAGTSNGNTPFGSLMQAYDGNLYGMTEQGGLGNAGVLFRYNPSTSVLTKMFDFDGAAPDGQNPVGSLMQASDGNLYEMTHNGGVNNEGVIFRYNPSTFVLTKVIDFDGASNGAYPNSALIQATDGNLYGVTAEGGANNLGVLFQYNPATSVLTRKIDFAGASNGEYPYASLVQASDGNLYGMTGYGGAYGAGVLFQYNPSTSVLTNMIDFAGAANGAVPDGALIQAADGNLYGMTYFGGTNGGPNGDGVLFQYNPSTSILTKMIDFDETNGQDPTGSLVQASDGNLYGMTAAGGVDSVGVLFRYNPSTSVLTKMVDFAGASNGQYPVGSLLQASDSNLYGMTSRGGANDYGVLFQFNPGTSTLTKKLDFNGLNGQYSQNDLIEINSTIASVPVSTADFSTVVYPNPSTGLFTITTVLSSSQLTVTNVLGELIYKANVTNRQVQIDLSKEAGGIYFYQLVAENKFICGGKMIVQ